MYTDLKSYQQSLVICDFTMAFVKKYIPKKSRTCDQMEQAARSGKQNIVEGCSVSKTSPKTELFLLGVARGSLKELLEDYMDFARQKGLVVWGMHDTRAQAMRQLAYENRPYKTDTSYKTYRSYESYLGHPEQAANAMITLVNQTTYLIDQQ